MGGKSVRDHVCLIALITVTQESRHLHRGEVGSRRGCAELGPNPTLWSH